MTSQEAVERLQRQIACVEELTRRPSGSPEFRKWHRDTEVLIGKVFGEGTRHSKDFSRIHYTLLGFTTSTPESAFEEAYRDGLESARAVLESFVQELGDFGDGKVGPASSPDVLGTVGHICLRFHGVANQLRCRHQGRVTLEIEDEYDVQNLMHALLRLHFDDVRDEEWTPSYAGGCSRVDFLLKPEEMVIEVKKTRKGLGAREVGDQLLIDIQRYHTHPSCKALVCFVYDPEGRVANPRGLEADLSGPHGSVEVAVIIAPRGN